jgi:hypothetical protein
LGYSQKGWTDNEIGIEYAKHLESTTQAAAKKRWRLLYVDGHRSHIRKTGISFFYLFLLFLLLLLFAQIAKGDKVKKDE